MTILIITQDFDPTVDPVVERLAERGHPAVRFDLADFPKDMAICANDFTGARWLDVRGHHVDLGEVDSIWYRRPTAFTFDDALLDHEREFAATESALGIGGLFRSMDALWVNRPDADAVASLKPYQLRLADRLGLRTPRTLITNDPDQVRKLLVEGNRLIYKVFGAGLVHGAGQIPALAYTTEISDIDDASLARIRHTPCTVQELVEKRYEVRLTIIGRTMLVATIDSQCDPTTEIDWRSAEGQLTYGPPLEPPAQVVAAMVRMVEALGLSYGAADFIVTPEGDWVFLEINASGQFMWLEHELGLPMTETMADLLLGGTAMLAREPVVIAG